MFRGKYGDMRILITGNLGYVGPSVVRVIKSKRADAQLYGYDSGFFAQNLTAPLDFPERFLEKQFFGDTRDMTIDFLEGFDAVVQLAAVSNDPMGKEFESVTDEINRRASVQIAKMSAAAGVKNFVFASSCSMYGSASDAPKTEKDETNPQTAYAHSKIGTEEDLEHLDLGEMIVSNLRFSTACGMSDRLRLDLVLNDFTASAIATGKITVLSDGTPWRPLIDVEDMARAILWAVERKGENGGNLLSVNVGRSDWNYQVRDIADVVKQHVKGCDISINSDAPPDTRSYKVDFSLYESLAPDFVPKVDLDESVTRLIAGLKRMDFSDSEFRNSKNIRLFVLREHIQAGRLDSALRWA